MATQQSFELHKSYENDNQTVYKDVDDSIREQIDQNLIEQMEEEVKGEIEEKIFNDENIFEYSNYENMQPTMDEYNQINQNGDMQNIDNRTIPKKFPRQVMTALGPLPLPEEFRNNIPEKFVAKPIIEEREIYVSKKERKEREIEIPHVKYEHTFKNVKKQLRVSKLVPTVSEVVKEIPKEVLKPVIEEKIIEVPQGVKYVEVPVEVPCLYPPKIIPKVVTQYVERIVETIKPIVQEKIIEVPQTVIKQIPKIKTVEVPYYVPRYVEKIVEVPFKPNGEMPNVSSTIPFTISENLPPLKPTHLLTDTNELYKNNENMINTSYEGMNTNGVMMSNMSQSLNQNMFKSNISNADSIQLTKNFIQSNINPNINNRQNLSSQIQNMTQNHNLPQGINWGYPDGVNPPLMKKSIPPIVVTCPPEIGKVTCANKHIKPDILTKSGVYEFDGFKKNGTSSALFPPLAPHNKVPFLPSPAMPGTPDVHNMQR